VEKKLKMQQQIQEQQIEEEERDRYGRTAAEVKADEEREKILMELRAIERSMRRNLDKYNNAIIKIALIIIFFIIFSKDYFCILNNVYTTLSYKHDRMYYAYIVTVLFYLVRFFGVIYTLLLYPFFISNGFFSIMTDYFYKITIDNFLTKFELLPINIYILTNIIVIYSINLFLFIIILENVLGIMFELKNIYMSATTFTIINNCIQLFIDFWHIKYILYTEISLMTFTEKLICSIGLFVLCYIIYDLAFIEEDKPVEMEISDKNYFF
jgi:hypothetical protein